MVYVVLLRLLPQQHEHDIAPVHGLPGDFLGLLRRRWHHPGCRRAGGGGQRECVARSPAARPGDIVRVGVGVNAHVWTPCDRFAILHSKANYYILLQIMINADERGLTRVRRAYTRRSVSFFP